MTVRPEVSKGERSSILPFVVRYLTTNGVSREYSRAASRVTSSTPAQHIPPDEKHRQARDRQQRAFARVARVLPDRHRRNPHHGGEKQQRQERIPRRAEGRRFRRAHAA